MTTEANARRLCRKSWPSSRRPAACRLCNSKEVDGERGRKVNAKIYIYIYVYETYIYTYIHAKLHLSICPPGNDLFDYISVCLFIQLSIPIVLSEVSGESPMALEV